MLSLTNKVGGKREIVLFLRSLFLPIKYGPYYLVKTDHLNNQQQKQHQQRQQQNSCSPLFIWNRLLPHAQNSSTETVFHSKLKLVTAHNACPVEMCAINLIRTASSHYSRIA